MTISSASGADGRFPRGAELLLGPGQYHVDDGRRPLPDRRRAELPAPRPLPRVQARPVAAPALRVGEPWRDAYAGVGIETAPILLDRVA